MDAKRREELLDEISSLAHVSKDGGEYQIIHNFGYREEDGEWTFEIDTEVWKGDHKILDDYETTMSSKGSCWYCTYYTEEEVLKALINFMAKLHDQDRDYLEDLEKYGKNAPKPVRCEICGDIIGYRPKEHHNHPYFSLRICEDCFKASAEQIFDPSEFDIYEVSAGYFEIRGIEERGVDFGYRYGTIIKEGDKYTAIIAVQGRDYYNEAYANTLKEALEKLKQIFNNVL